MHDRNLTQYLPEGLLEYLIEERMSSLFFNFKYRVT
jgi:hypothetical protein